MRKPQKDAPKKPAQVEPKTDQAAEAQAAAISLLSDDVTPTLPVEAAKPATEAVPQESSPVQPLDQPKRKAYRVTAVRPCGFWALKHHYGYNQPEIVLADTLTKEQVADLEGKPRQALLVELVEV